MGLDLLTTAGQTDRNLIEYELMRDKRIVKDR